MSTSSKPIPCLAQLVALFYDTQSDLADFSPVANDAVPDPYAELLAHNQHMTVTVERFHGSTVDVEVLNEKTSATFYARKILLRRQDDQQVVQFGIVRLNLRHLDQVVVNEIQQKQKPLGHVLIDRNVLREVELSQVWRVRYGYELESYFRSENGDSTNGRETYGRTAMIYCDGEPAIELLEIVSPAN